MKLGIHFMNFTHPDGGAALRAAVGDTALGVGLVELAPAMPDPVGYVTMRGEKIVGPLSEIG